GLERVRVCTENAWRRYEGRGLVSGRAFSPGLERLVGTLRPLPTLLRTARGETLRELVEAHGSLPITHRPNAPRSPSGAACVHELDARTCSSGATWRWQGYSAVDLPQVGREPPKVSPVRDSRLLGQRRDCRFSSWLSGKTARVDGSTGAGPTAK